MNESVLGDDTPALESNVDGNDQGKTSSNEAGELTDKYGNPANEDLHRKSNKDGQEWDTYESDEHGTCVRCKRGKAGEAERRAKHREKMPDSKVGYDQEDEIPDTEELSPQEKAQRAVDNFTWLLTMYAGDEWEPSDKEKERMVRAHERMIRESNFGTGHLDAPWWAEFALAYGSYVKTRTIGGPGGIMGLVDVASWLTGIGQGNDQEDVEDDKEETPDKNVEYDHDEDEPADNPQGLEKYDFEDE